MNEILKVGDKVTKPAVSMRGKVLPPMEWRVTFVNKATYTVHAEINVGLPTYGSYSLYLNKTTGLITR